MMKVVRVKLYENDAFKRIDYGDIPRVLSKAM